MTEKDLCIKDMQVLFYNNKLNFEAVLRNLS